MDNVYSSESSLSDSSITIPSPSSSVSVSDTSSSSVLRMPSATTVSAIANIMTTTPVSSSLSNGLGTGLESTAMNRRRRLYNGSRGQQIALVFSFQGLGSILGSMVLSILLSIHSVSLDSVWRIAVGIGAVPSIIMIYWRLQLEESNEYLQSKTQQQQQQLQTVDSHTSSWSKESGRNEHIHSNKIDKNDTVDFNTDTETNIPGNDNDDDNEESALLLDDITDTTTFSVNSIVTFSSSSSSSFHPSSTPEASQTGIRHSPRIPLNTRTSLSSPTNIFSTIPYFCSRLCCCSPSRSSSLQYTLSIIYTYRYELLGTAGSWFIFDIIFYANNLFSGTILEMMGITNRTEVPSSFRNHTLSSFSSFSSSIPSFSDTDDRQFRQRMLNETYGNLLLTSIGYIGMIISIIYIDRIGRKILQLSGFLFVSLCYLLLGILIRTILINHRFISTDGYPSTNGITVIIILYSLSFLFSNLPNTTTFVIPAEIFPSNVKATCHGISAASGKLGAIVGAGIMGPLLLQSTDPPPPTTSSTPYRALETVMYLSAAIAFVGGAWTYRFTK